MWPPRDFNLYFCFFRSVQHALWPVWKIFYSMWPASLHNATAHDEELIYCHVTVNHTVTCNVCSVTLPLLHFLHHHLSWLLSSLTIGWHDYDEVSGWCCLEEKPQSTSCFRSHYCCCCATSWSSSASSSSTSPSSSSCLAEKPQSISCFWSYCCYSAITGLHTEGPSQSIFPPKVFFWITCMQQLRSIFLHTKPHPKYFFRLAPLHVIITSCFARRKIKSLLQNIRPSRVWITIYQTWWALPAGDGLLNPNIFVFSPP